MTPGLSPGNFIQFIAEPNILVYATNHKSRPSPNTKLLQFFFYLRLYTLQASEYICVRVEAKYERTNVNVIRLISETSLFSIFNMIFRLGDFSVD